MTKRLFVLILLVMTVLSGCQVATIDPLGMTERETIRVGAAVRAAEIEADAQRRAAEAQADAQKHVANQETIQASMWASMVPVALLIVGVTVVVALVVNWQGRIWYERTTRATPAPYTQQMAAPAINAAELRALAKRQGYRIEADEAFAYLVDQRGKRVARRLLIG